MELDSAKVRFRAYFLDSSTQVVSACSVANCFDSSKGTALLTELVS